MKIAIRQGRVIDPANQLDTITDIAIKDGKIFHVGPIPADFIPDHTVDAKNQWVIPGIIDVYCHPRIQNAPKPTLIHEAKNALAHGITALCIPPDSDPIIDTPAFVVRLKNQSEKPLPHLYPMGALTQSLAGKTIADLTALAENGCIAFTNVQKPITDLRMIKHCYDYASSFNLTCVIQAQDPWLARGAIAHEGMISTRLGLKGIPEVAETIAIAQHLLLVEACEVRAHFTGLSSARAVEQIRQAKANGLPVTADTAMHSLHLSEMDVSSFDPNCHLYPPLRSIRDQAGLLAGINDNTLDAICSDHRPLHLIQKLAPFGETTPGLSAIDTFLSLGIHLVKQNKITPDVLIGAITHRAANIFKLPGGTLSVGANADVCIVDPNQFWQVTDETLMSMGKNTPFKEWELPGKVTATFLQGHLVYDATRNIHP